MSEFNALPKRESYPLVSSNDTLVVVCRDHLLAASPPMLFIKALGDAEFRVDSSRDLDPRPGYQVLDFSNGGGDTLTLTVNGTATVLTEGAQFAAVANNALTAINIADAINTAAINGVTAVSERDTVKLILNDHIVSTLVLATGDATAWDFAPLTLFGTPQTLAPQESTAVDLPIGTFDPLNKVAFLEVIKGRVSVDIRSPVECRSYFKQPGEPFGSATLAATTGHPGGWPTSPSPPPP